MSRFKLLSRNNTKIGMAFPWNPCMNPRITKYGNRGEKRCFKSIDELETWMNAKQELPADENKDDDHLAYKTSNGMNADPVRIYAVYKCDHGADPMHELDDSLADEFLYCMSWRYASDDAIMWRGAPRVPTWMMFKRDQRNYGKIGPNKKFEFSEKMYEKDGMFYEGVGHVNTKYFNISDLVEWDQDKDHRRMIQRSDKKTRAIDLWFIDFVNKLDLVQQGLMGCLGQGSWGRELKLTISEGQQALINELTDLYKLLDPRDQGKKFGKELRAFIATPAFFNGQVYSCRYKNTIVHWHKNFSTFVRRYHYVPSEEFYLFIRNFQYDSLLYQMPNMSKLQKILDKMKTII